MNKLYLKLIGIAYFLVCFVSAQGAALSIRYELSRPARVSLLITDANGNVVRELLHAAPRPAGANTETWDGLNDHAQPAPAGSYRWKLLSTQGLQAEYLLTLGTNPTPAWDTWPGNHGGSYSLAGDAAGMYVGVGCGEGTVSVVKQSLDGKRRFWELPELGGWLGPSSIAVDGSTTYLLVANAKIYRVDPATGKSLGPPWSVSTNQCTGRLSVRDGQIVMTTPTGLAWLDNQTGAVIDQADLPAVLDVKLDVKGHVLAISQGAICSLTRDAKTPQVVIPQKKLNSPYRLALDASDDAILVAENAHPVGDNYLPRRPAPLRSGNQVKRFSAKGRLLRTYGRAGGRLREGRYDATAGFLGVCDIAAADRGGFIVTEPVVAPRRTAHFNARGKLVREWYGGQQYANYAEPDPADPSLVWLDSQWGELIQAKVDYERKTWKVRATYQFALLADHFVRQTYHGGGRWHVRHHDNQTYLLREDTLEVLRVDEAGRRLVPLVAGMLNVAGYNWPAVPELEKQATVKKLITAAGKTPAEANAFLWMDGNGDGRPQADEMNFSAFPSWWSTWSPGVDFDYYANDGKKIYRLPVRSWSKGVPQYADWKELEAVAQIPPVGPAQVGLSTDMCWDRDGSMYTAMNTDSAKAFGVGDWAVRVGGNRVIKWGKDGKLQWAVGRHSATSGAAPGEGRCLRRVLGAVHGCVVVSDTDQSLVHVWDKDGLWVGRLLDDPDLKAAPASAYKVCIENFGGSLYENPKTGEVLFFGGGINNSPVYRITGWDQFQRQHGNITLP